jgi:hypothetical protein
MLIQWPDRYYHTDLDTPDRCDPASLALAVRSAATYAGFIAGAGAAECHWLLGLVSRAARRRMLAALDGPTPWSRAEGERERGLRALASLGRLALGTPAHDPIVAELRAQLPLAVEELEGFWESEVLPGLVRQSRPALRFGGRVPERLLAGLLPPMRSLCAGWDALPQAERIGWSALEDALPGGGTACDVSWFACDGMRGIGDIEAMLEREGHDITPGALEQWFDALTRLGVVRWRDETR